MSNVAGYESIRVDLFNCVVFNNFKRTMMNDILYDYIKQTNIKENFKL